MINHSSLSDHDFNRGKFITPINKVLAGNMKDNPWFQLRLPEYLWLALILKYYGREDGLVKCNLLLRKVSEYKSLIELPKFSSILNLPDDEQKKLFIQFSEIIDNEAVAPLTAIFTYTDARCFATHFFTQISLEERIESINEVISKLSYHQTEFATDLRFLVVYYLLLVGQLHTSKENLELLMQYPTLTHSNETMRMIRPMIRAIEVGLPNDINNDYLNTFWEGVSRLSDCELFKIDIKPEHNGAEMYISKIKEFLQYYTELFTSTRPLDNRMLVILGIATYSYKRLLEVVEHNLYQTIVGRSVVRVLIENYIMLKYLLKNESSHKDIWTEYQYYGIGQYKLIVEKHRESGKDLSDSHVMYDYMDLLVNEYKDEEFIDMDTSYFNNDAIRVKAQKVDEKELYGLYYDYDSAFEHGLWGAIRESSLLKCNSPSHQYHCVPDIENEQKLKDIWCDCEKIMDKIMKVLEDEYGLPNYFKTEVTND